MWRILCLPYDPTIMELRALVVCPDQDSASLLAPVLAEMGMTVEHTTSLSRGLQLIDEEHFDAIIFDYQADQPSEEFLARFRQCGKNRATMLIAIVAPKFNARPVFGLGANFVLYRPLSIERTRLSLQAARGLIRRERRRAPRAAVASPVNISYPGAPDVNATMNDISDTGTLITSTRRLPDAGKVYFEFSLPGQRHLVRLSGEVAWQDSSGRTGIRFLDVPQASRRLIQSFLLKAVGHQADNAKTSTDPSKHPSPKGHETKTRKLVEDTGNRRGELRFPCKIGAEVYRLGTNVPNRCSLSDISEGGCYVEMPTPLQGQSGVEILVRTADVKFKVRGEVLATHPGFGMGVRFIFRDPAEKSEIMRLLGVLATGTSLETQAH